MFATIVLAAALAAIAPADADSDMCLVDAAEEVDASRCWSTCNACVNRSKDKQSCYDMNASCCEANGKKGNFMGCGCH